MLIENAMYFVLGFLGAGLLALMIMPSIWRRAVRLTKKRIEAATPMTMSEYRADKDQLRAEFALSTRRLELNVDALRKRLTDQVSEVNRRKAEAAQIRAERDEQLVIVRELEEREAQLRRRILDLEKEGTDLAQRLRMRDRDYDAKVQEVERLRSADGTLSAGHVDELLNALERERARSERLEEQVHTLISRLENQDQHAVEAHEQISLLRQSLSEKTAQLDHDNETLLEAEARIANAESRLNQLLQETQNVVEQEEAKTGRLLAEKLSLEDQLSNLRGQVTEVESSILQDWDAERIEQSFLRERLNDIASEVSRLVFSVEEESATAEPESLFDRIQRFSDEDLATDTMPQDPGRHAPEPTGRSTPQSGGRLSDRMRALKEMQVRQPQ